MESYFKEGFAEMVLSDDTNHPEVWYLPNQLVINPKPEKLRTVFDCGAKCNGKSLKKPLTQVPTLINFLGVYWPGFVKKCGSGTADVKSMFHHVKS